MKNKNDTQIASLRRTLFRDPRIIAGLVLILISSLIGSWIFRSIASGHEAYQVVKTVPAGEVVKAADLHLVTVRVPNPNDYVGKPAEYENQTTKHTLSPGDLLMRSALTKGAPDQARIVVNPIHPLPRSVHVGDSVQIWALSQKASFQSSQDLPSQVLASGCIIRDLQEKTNAVVSGGRYQVELAVAKQYLSAVMDALGEKRQLVLVPTSEAN